MRIVHPNKCIGSLKRNERDRKKCSENKKLRKKLKEKLNGSRFYEEPYNSRFLNYEMKILVIFKNKRIRLLTPCLNEGFSMFKEILCDACILALNRLT